MKAVVYRGPREVTVENVPDPKIERPTDAIARPRRVHRRGRNGSARHRAAIRV
nr:hypothetical protein [Caballeronia sp. GACF5]